MTQRISEVDHSRWALARQHVRHCRDAYNELCQASPRGASGIGARPHVNIDYDLHEARAALLDALDQQAQIQARIDATRGSARKRDAVREVLATAVDCIGALSERIARRLRGDDD